MQTVLYKHEIFFTIPMNRDNNSKLLSLLLWMEEILNQLIGTLFHYLYGFNHPRCRISSINSIIMINRGFYMFLHHYDKYHYISDASIIMISITQQYHYRYYCIIIILKSLLLKSCYHYYHTQIHNSIIISIFPKFVTLITRLSSSTQSDSKRVPVVL